MDDGDDDFVHTLLHRKCSLCILLTVCVKGILGNVVMINCFLHGISNTVGKVHNYYYNTLMWKCSGVVVSK